MRELTLKGYLERQMCELYGTKTKSLYKLSHSAENNARLKDTLSLYLRLYVKNDLRNKLLKRFPSLYDSRLDDFDPNFNNGLSEYKTIYENYLYQKNIKSNEEKVKELMYDRIIELKNKKNISTYRIYKDLKLNHGNVNAFIKNRDFSKVGLNTIRNILAYLNEK